MLTAALISKDRPLQSLPPNAKRLPLEKLIPQFLLLFSTHFPNELLQIHSSIVTETVAFCILHYFASYGLMDVFHSDPGSEFQNEVVRQLLKWLGSDQTVTLVDNPQADGVERINGEIMKLLKMLVADERLKDKWSDGTVLPWVQIQVNSWVNSATGYSAYELQYGSMDCSYFQYPVDSPNSANQYLEKLGDNMQLVRKISEDVQKKVKEEYARGTPDDARVTYDVGQFVFHIIDSKLKVGNKLNSKKRGPYEVIEHLKDSNVVEVKDLITHKILKLNQKDLEVFNGSRDSAFKLASLDDDQHVLESVIGYIGNPEKRSSMQFLLRFADGDELWFNYSQDICTTKAFEEYCKSKRHLSILLLQLDEVRTLKRIKMGQDVVAALKGKIIYLNIRLWGPTWYQDLVRLKDRYKVDYYVAANVTQVRSKQRDYTLHIPVFHTAFVVTNWFMYLHGSVLEPEDDAIVIDDAFAATYSIVPGSAIM